MAAKVCNVPEYAAEYRYMVVTKDKSGKFAWFWGAFKSLERAGEVAKEIGGEVLEEWEAITG